MRSKKLIVGDERQEDFDRLAAGWRAEYEPEGQAGESLIERVIVNDWVLQRAERNFLHAEWELAELEASEHTPEELEAKHGRVQLYLRYRTTAERSFYRAYYALRGLRKDKIKEELDLEKWREEMKRAVRQEATIAVVAARDRQKVETDAIAARKAAELAAGQRENAAQPKRKKNSGPVVVEQWVEVAMEGGRAVTKLYPSNAELKQAAEANGADLVYRRINFPHGIPAEYGWVAPADDVERRERGGAGIQRMTVETWLRATRREQANADGHVGPTGVGNLPRPMERGGCDCEVCARNRELLERRVA